MHTVKLSTESVPTPSDAIRTKLAEARGRAIVRGTTVIDELVESGLPTELEAFESQTGVQAWIDTKQVVEASAIDVDGTTVLLVVGEDQRQWLLLGDPWNHTLVAAAQQQIGRFVEPAAASGQVLMRCASDSLNRERPLPGRETGEDSAEGIVSFVDRSISAAYRDGASDLHFECDRRGVTVKLRLDGVMTPFSRIEGQLQAEEVVSRIKVLAQLDITERRLPQDGRFRFHGSEDGPFDLRVSVMPSVFGEDVVLRLLDKSRLRAVDQQVTLDGLGFDVANIKDIRWLANLPNGMLLVTGPTGSGKTTTVYAALSEINTGLEKIITIEDPVEYELPGVLQIPVNERKGLTFAKGLRSILRHDPDRILVGEIRDGDTAAIAVQSSLTGHLVFTTVHANSLFDVIGRFRHFGIDMFGFLSSLNGIVVQRLMRHLCKQCAQMREATADEAEWLGQQGAADLALALPRPLGCAACRHTGYRGRFVIAEVHRITDPMRDLIMKQGDVTELKRLAFSGGMKTLLQHGLDQVRLRKTSIEELFRVVGQV